MSILDFFILSFAAVMALYLALSPRLSRSVDWQATIVPLASIMGSGFLISAPLLAGTVGIYAVFFMAGLLAIAFCVGGVLRFNIKNFEPIELEKGLPQRVSLISHWILVGAYFISVSYYLQLLAAFVLNYLGVDNLLLAKTITSVFLLIICGFGMAGGIGSLGKLEKLATSFNLSVVSALILSLVFYNFKIFSQGNWVTPNLNTSIDFEDVRILLGLLIVVQGFETSRYLGGEFTSEVRVRTMRKAQLLSAVIYLLFISLCTVLFKPHLGADVTAIIKMTAPVSVVLPLVISLTAICSQFSASVADSEGAGGLLDELTNGKLKPKIIYLGILTMVGAICWLTNVNEIIAYASRAFALYYSLQAVVAVLIVDKVISKNKMWQKLFLGIIGCITFIVFLLGVPAG